MFTIWLQKVLSHWKSCWNRTVFPIEIFPQAVRPLLKLTPIYTVCYGPAKMAVDFQAGQYFEILLAQLLYLAAGLALMFIIYGKGGKKLYVNGG